MAESLAISPRIGASRSSTSVRGWGRKATSAVMAVARDRTEQSRVLKATIVVDRPHARRDFKSANRNAFEIEGFASISTFKR